MNWTALAKTVAAAAVGAGIQQLASSLPAMQDTKYGPGLAAAVLAAAAYGARSPWADPVAIRASTVEKQGK